jgi:hypothetical protein
MTSAYRRSFICALILLITIPIGLAVRYAPLHLPWFLYKYLGSFLWAVALYWFIATLFPKLHTKALAIISTTVALAVEFSRLIPIDPIDAFRLTLPGQILLGRYFSIKNIAAYLLAIATSALLDHHFHRQKPPFSPKP